MKDGKKIIGFFPLGEMSNSYTKNFIEIIKNIGEIHRIRYFPGIGFRGDLAIVNWLESSLINSKGDFSVSGAVKYLIKIAILKINYKKVIYVLHNSYPHGTNANSVEKIKNIIRFASKFCDSVVVHSGDNRFKNNFYIPHPLYKFNKTECANDINQDNYYIIFGRIVKYKKIEETLNSISSFRKIIVCGKCEDKDYLSKLIFDFGDRVDFLTENISDDFARDLHKKSNGALVCHSEDDMIVSGSILFALSCGKKVYVKNMPYAEWLSGILGVSCIENFKNIDELILGIKKDENKNINFDDSVLKNHFSEKSIEDSIKNFL